MKRKWVFLGIALAVILAGVLLFFQIRARQQAEAASKFETVSAGRGGLTATVGGTGTVHPNQTTILSWKTSGTVELVMVVVGDKVIANQTLSSLDLVSLPQNVILARAELTEAQRALDDLYTNAETMKTTAIQSISKYAQAVRDAQYQLDNYTVSTNQAGLSAIEGLDLMKKNLDQARTAFEPVKYLPLIDTRREDLKDALDIAQSDYNAAVKRLEYEYTLDAAQANLEKARQDFAKYENGPTPEDIAAAEARIAAAQTTLDQAFIKAPIAGVVTEVNSKPGDQVNPGALAFRVDDFSSLLVDVQISEIDINRIQVGQEVKLSFDAILNKEYLGVVKDVSPVGEVTQGVVDFTVTVEITDADEAVRPGMTAAANIIVTELEDVLLVPNRAVRLLEGKRVVYVMKNGLPEPVQITLGASSETNSEVLTGELVPGDLIVLNPPVVFEQNGPPPFVNR